VPITGGVGLSPSCRGEWNSISSSRPLPSGVCIIATSFRTPSSATMRSTVRPSMVAVPCSSRPSLAKNAVAAGRSSTTMPTCSIRRSVTFCLRPARRGCIRRSAVSMSRCSPVGRLGCVLSDLLAAERRDSSRGPLGGRQAANADVERGRSPPAQGQGASASSASCSCSASVPFARSRRRRASA
jgi:hypothetical protein